MARVIEPDSIDYAAYERATETRVKVRKASVFGDALKAHFALRDGQSRHAGMTSTKLRGLIEFRPGEVTAWAGYNGHRKSMFAGQVALDLVDSDQRVLIASMEMQPERTLGRMARQANGGRHPAPNWVDQFMRWTDDRLWLFDHMGRITPSACLAVCLYFAEELKGRHVFIDSMMMVCRSEEHLDEQKQFVTDLCRLAQESGLHVHLITHCRKPQTGEERPPSKYDIRGAAAISDQVSNVITVWTKKNKKEEAQAEPDVLIGVEKQRNGAWEGKVKLWFDDASLRFCDEQPSVFAPVRAYDLGAL